MAAYSVIANQDGEDPNAAKNPAELMAAMMGPGYADQAVRGAVQACWMSLPKDRRNIEQLENEMNRLVARAISNLREDNEAFKVV